MRRIGVVGLLVGVVALLVPPGVGAQSASSTATPGPCEQGWVAPTPTTVAVSSVPIRVASTADDYFVLYVKHRRGPTTVWDLPVSVTRGEPGATTLPSNLAPLSADKYRVEKYLIASPADVDGDCVDDITELDNLGYRNPTNAAISVPAYHGQVAIPDRAAFEKLSYQSASDVGADKHLTNLEYVKFWILNIYSAKPKVWFQDTNQRLSHWHFPSVVGNQWPYIKSIWSGAMTGTLVYHPNTVAADGTLGVYRFEFQPWDHFAFKEIALANETLAAAMPFLADNLAYYPIGSRAIDKYKNEKAKYDDSRVNILRPKDVMPDVEYVALNEAEGYGLLREIEPGETPGSRDVAILKVLPNDLPRVAGIITTVPQTPLSHVNLRAIQAGAPNAFIRDALKDDDIGDLIGSHVYYKTTAQGYTLRAATKAEVDTHHNSSRPAASQTPARDLTVQAITSLDGISFDDWDAFGVKAANMAELSGLSALAAGVVPEGFAVPFYFYDEFMKQATLSAETVLGKKSAPAEEKITLAAGTTPAAAVSAMLAHPQFQTDFAIQEEMLDDLRKAIKKATSPAWIITALETMHAAYPDGTSLRYRSSTNNEDLPDFNGAGLYDSKTQDPDETVDDGIDKSIKGVWASLWNFRAFLEREYHRVDHLATAMGVLVHPNYSDELANGVAVSFDPVRGLDDTYYVNTQLGEDLVTNPEANSLAEQLLLDSAGTATVLARSNLAPPGELLMSDAQMVELRNGLKAIHDHFATLYGAADGDDFAMEIEFKITSDDKLAIKQARPWVFSEPLACVPQLPSDAVTLSEVTGWRDGHSGAAHVLRWNRVLEALGTDTGTGAAAMTVAESRANEGVFMASRWDRVTRTLEAIGTCDDPPPPPPEPEISITAGGSAVEGDSASFTLSASPVPTAALTVDVTVAQQGDFGVTTGSRTVTISTAGTGSLTVSTSDDSLDEADGSVSVTVAAADGYTVSATSGSASVAVSDDDDAPPPVCTPQLPPDAVSVGEVTGWRDGHSGAAHVLRWNRVLEALGHDTGTAAAAMTVAESRANEGLFMFSRWDRVTRTLEALDACDDPRPPPPPVEPEISIAAGNGVIEGGSATFALSASPAPSAALTVDVSVAQSGDFGVTTGSRTVTISTSGSATLTVSTSDDSIDEPDGSVTVTVDDANGYTVSATAGSASMAVADDDDPPPPPPPPEPEISIVAGNGVVEGGSATFTLTASPVPSSPLSVDVTVAQQGDFGVTVGSRQVTISISGSVTLSVTTSGDSADEADGSVAVTVDDGSGYTVSATEGSASVFVADDDDDPPPPPPPVRLPPSQVSFSAEDASAAEGEVLRFRIMLSDAANARVRVYWRTRYSYAGEISAFPDVDYPSRARGWIAFEPGEVEKWVDIALPDDTVGEPAEVFQIYLSFTEGGATIADRDATMTITDNDRSEPD